ncbi:MAG TPA: sodium/proline symporter PutP [Lachnospiraceae bacterium]
MSNTIITLISFIVYLIFMILIGVWSMKKTNNTEDYFLGGRGLGAWVTALSAQASDMSGWLLMGLPGAVYALGTGQAWIAIGLFIGTVLNWILISGRLRRYTFVSKNSLTLPEFLGNRFRDDRKILLCISSIIIAVFFLVYTASGFAAGGKLFSSVFGMEYHIALTLGAVVILAYTFMGGFLAVSMTDFFQGLLMFAGLILVPLIAYISLGGEGLKSVLDQKSAVESASSFLNLFENAGKPIGAKEIVSQLAWGLGYCGMPHILVRFMAVKNEKELNKSKVIAITWAGISLVMAILIGIIGRAYLMPILLGEVKGTSVENVFIEMIKKVFMEDYDLVFIGGIFLCGILAAIMSTADSQLLVTASAISKDLYKGILKKNAKDKSILLVSRISVLAVAIVAYIIAWNPNNSIMGLVSNAWAGLGAAFGPLIVMSLFWKRINLQGAVAGLISGGLTVIVWDYFPVMGGKTLGVASGIYSLLVGFIISLFCIILVSLFTPKPSEEIIKEFESVK